MTVFDSIGDSISDISVDFEDPQTIFAGVAIISGLINLYYCGGSIKKCVCRRSSSRSAIRARRNCNQAHVRFEDEETVIGGQIKDDSDDNVELTVPIHRVISTKDAGINTLTQHEETVGGSVGKDGAIVEENIKNLVLNDVTLQQEVHKTATQTIDEIFSKVVREQESKDNGAGVGFGSDMGARKEKNSAVQCSASVQNSETQTEDLEFFNMLGNGEFNKGLEQYAKDQNMFDKLNFIV